MSAPSKASRVRKFSRMVLEQTGGGRALVEFLVGVYEGTVEGVSMRDRIEASKILLDRALGKAPLTIDVTGTVNHRVSTVDVRRLSDEDLQTIRRTLRRAVVAELPAATDEEEDADVSETPPTE